MNSSKWFFGIAVVLSVVLTMSQFVQAQSASNPDAEAAYNAGLQHLEQENWEQAIDAFNNALSLDGTDVYAAPLVGLGDAYRELENYEAALQFYLQATAMYEGVNPTPEEAPLAARAYNGRGVCQREVGNYDMAERDFDTAIQFDRNNADIAANYGDILLSYGRDPVQAMPYLEKAIELDPSNADAYRNRGMVHTQLREYQQAVADLNKSIEIEPAAYETYTMLANTYLAQQDFEPAIEALTNAIEYYEPERTSDPKIFVDGFLARSRIQLQIAVDEETAEDERQSLYQAALSDADMIVEEFEDRPESGIALYQRGVALRMLERYSEAIKALTDSIQIAGGEGQYSSSAYLKRGICWHYQGQESLARGDLEQAAAMNFEDPLPHLWIGLSYAQEGDYRAAIESYGEAISKKPSFPTPYVNRGLAYMQLGDYKKAIDNFNAAIRNEPTEAEHFYKRGIAYMQVADYQKAVDSFELAILNDGNMEKAVRAKAAASSRL